MNDGTFNLTCCENDKPNQPLKLIQLYHKLQPTVTRKETLEGIVQLTREEQSGLQNYTKKTRTKLRTTILQNQHLILWQM